MRWTGEQVEVRRKRRLIARGLQGCKTEGKCWWEMWLCGESAISKKRSGYVRLCIFRVLAQLNSSQIRIEYFISIKISNILHKLREYRIWKLYQQNTNFLLWNLLSYWLHRIINWRHWRLVFALSVFLDLVIHFGISLTLSFYSIRRYFCLIIIL